MKSESHAFNKGKKIIISLFCLSLVPVTTFALPYPTLDDHPVKVKLGEVGRKSDLLDVFSLKLASSTLSVSYSASTTVFLGTGEAATLDDVERGEKVYVFGTPGNDEDSFVAEKIVIKNPSRLSRVNIEKNTSSSATLEKVSQAIALWTGVWKGLAFTTAYGAERIQDGIGYLASSSTGGILESVAGTTSSSTVFSTATSTKVGTSTPHLKKNELSIRPRPMI